MKVETIKQVLSRYPNKIRAAEALGVPASYINRWVEYGIIFIDGVPYRKMLDIKRI